MTSINRREVQTREALKAAIEKQKEEEWRTKMGQCKTPAKAGKQKVVSSSSSSTSLTTSSSEGEQPRKKLKATLKGRQATQKEPVRVVSQTRTVAMPKG